MSRKTREKEKEMQVKVNGLLFLPLLTWQKSDAADSFLNSPPQTQGLRDIV
jgi:hypothetical protein